MNKAKQGYILETNKHTSIAMPPGSADHKIEKEYIRTTLHYTTLHYTIQLCYTFSNREIVYTLFNRQIV